MEFTMQPKLLSKFVATPEGIVINGMALAKLSPRQAGYIQRAEELLAQVKKEEWESRTPHDANHVPTLAKVNMLLALAQPVRLGKANFNPEQARDEDGRWTDEGGDTKEPKAHILKSPKKYIHNSYPNAKGKTECVAFAQQVGHAPLTSQWVAGDLISPENPPPIGTWVATFVDGSYKGHVGVFNGYGSDGTLYLIDQFNSKGEVTNQQYYPGHHDYISNDITQYRVLKW